MKIGLVSAVCKNNDILHNINKIQYFAQKCSKEDYQLICFGESFVQGFDSVSWNYNKDKKIAITSNSNRINS